MRSGDGFEELEPFEMHLARVASECEPCYGAIGRVGYAYDSIKDQLRWNHLSVKEYASLIGRIGRIVSLSDEEYRKAKVKEVKMSDNAIAEALIAAFGDGKS